jgi:hypothetical protein
MPKIITTDAQNNIAATYNLKVCLNNNINTQVIITNGKIVIKEFITKKHTQLPVKTRSV